MDRKKVLWLEDQGNILRYLRETLKEVLNVDIYLTSDPIDFLERFENESYDLLMFDMIIYVPSKIEERLVKKIGDYGEPYWVGLYVLKYVLNLMDKDDTKRIPIFVLTILGEDTLLGKEVLSQIDSLKKKYEETLRIEVRNKVDGIYEILNSIKNLLSESVL